jgi:hypothetical protein
MATIDGLSIEVTAETADAQAALNAVEGDLDDVGGEAVETAAALGILAGRTESAADEMQELTGSAALASGGLFGLSSSSRGATVSLFGLNLSLQATIGLIAGLAAILAPLVALLGAAAAAVGGLALGFGAVLGVPLINNFKQISEAAKEAFADIQSVLQPLAEAFTPLLRSGIEALPGLFERIIDAVGGAEGLQPFADVLARLGGEVANQLPSLVSTLVDFGIDALPILEDFIQFLGNNGPEALAFFREIASEVGPPLAELTSVILDNLPAVTRIGSGLIQILAPALSAILRIVGPVAKAFAGLLDFLQPLIDGFELFARSVGVVLGGALTETFGYLGQMVDVLFDAIEPVALLKAGLRTLGNVIFTVFGGIRDFVVGAVNTLTDSIETVINALVGVINRGIDAANTVADLPGVENLLGGAQLERISRIDIAEVGGGGGGTQNNINIESINAGSRQGGRRAARGFKEEFGRGQNTLDTSRSL